MTTIDIRSNETPAITEIRFGDNYRNEEAFRLYNEATTVDIHSNNGYVELSDLDCAKNLLVAINKAIELGWFKNK